MGREKISASLALVICGGFLSGCLHQPRLVSAAPPLPQTAAVFSFIQQDAPEIILPPPMLKTNVLLSWISGMSDTNFVTGIYQSPDMVNWQELFETNCGASTNYLTVPITNSQEFFRAFNR